MTLSLAPAVRLAGISHTLPGGRRLFDDLVLDIGLGESLALLGPSGVGKSSLLRIVAGLDPVDSGSIDFDGLGDSERPDLAVVFQQPHLYPWLTVRENIALGARFRSTRDRVDTGHVDELLAHFGIAELAEARPDSLSGGQAQRVAVVRAAATRPRLLLLDEPFSALDPLTRAECQRWLVDVTNELEVTSLLVTHDVDEALVVGSRIALLGHSGRIEQTWENPGRGTVDDPTALRPEILGAYAGRG